MSTRMMVTLDPEQHRRLKVRAAAAGISLAEYIRRLVAAELDEGPPAATPEAITSLFDSGGSDVAAHKDAYIAQAVQDRL